MTEIICDLCRAIPLDLFDFEKRPYKHEHAPSFQHLKKSAQRGCASCKIFDQSLQMSVTADTPIVLLSRSNSFTKNDGDIYIHCGHDWTSEFDIFKGFGKLNWLIHPESSQEEIFGNPQYLHPDPGCDENIELIKGLVEDCLADHPSCRITEQRPLPTRLLDLGEEPEFTMVRVVPGSHCSERRARYLTLSHCWGKAAIDAPWKLTVDRMEEFASGVPVDILPKTFQETIDIVKRIGQRYLWIDSMCIIQDSKEDWEVEASRMADVYGGSLCTISTATDSTSSGCYLPRGTSPVLPVEWKLSQINSFGDQLDATVVLFSCFRFNYSSPVFRRAWCLQERELSHRLLQFQEDGWYWRCSMRRISERELYTEKYDRHGRLRRSMAQKLAHTSGRLQTTWETAYPKFSGTVAPQDRNEAYKYWRDIINEFSSCDITFLSDRMPALYGLMARQNSAFPDKYAYGIWELDIINGLCWSCFKFRDGDASIDTRIEPAIAPTWSILSLQAPVNFREWSSFNDMPDTNAWFEDTDEETVFTAIRGRGHLIEMRCSDNEYQSDDPQPEVIKCTSRVIFSDGEDGELYYDTLRDRELAKNFHCFLLRSFRKYFLGVALARVPWTKDEVPTFRRLGFYEGFVSDKGEPVDIRII